LIVPLRSKRETWLTRTPYRSFATDLNLDARTNPNDPKYSDSVIARIPVGRWGAPDDLKGPVVFLAASRAAVYVSGEILTVCISNLRGAAEKSRTDIRSTGRWGLVGPLSGSNVICRFLKLLAYEVPDTLILHI
jgi:hypothetical protein